MSRKELPTTFYRTMKQNLHFISPLLWIMDNKNSTKSWHCLKSFELQTIKKELSSYYNKYTN